MQENYRPSEGQIWDWLATREFVKLPKRGLFFCFLEELRLKSDLSSITESSSGEIIGLAIQDHFTQRKHQVVMGFGRHSVYMNIAARDQEQWAVDEIRYFGIRSEKVDGSQAPHEIANRRVVVYESAPVRLLEGRIMSSDEAKEYFGLLERLQGRGTMLVDVDGRELNIRTNKNLESPENESGIYLSRNSKFGTDYRFMVPVEDPISQVKGYLSVGYLESTQYQPLCRVSSGLEDLENLKEFAKGLEGVSSGLQSASEIAVEISSFLNSDEFSGFSVISPNLIVDNRYRKWFGNALELMKIKGSDSGVRNEALALESKMRGRSVPGEVTIPDEVYRFVARFVAANRSSFTLDYYAAMEKAQKGGFDWGETLEEVVGRILEDKNAAEDFYW